MRDQGHVAVRFGVKADPPTLVVEYASRQQGLKRPSRKEDGLRHKVLRLHHLGSSKASSCDKQHSAQDAAHRLARKFPDHFGTRVVKHTQLEGLILKLEGLVLQSSGTSGDSNGDDENHGGYDEVQVALRQQHSTVSDTKSVEAEGQARSTIGEALSSAAAESIAQDNSEEIVAAAIKTNSKPENNGQLSETVEAAKTQPEDLNHASESDLAAAKAQMNEVFQQNLRNPGAPGYVHDLRRDFGSAEEDCDWDED